MKRYVVTLIVTVSAPLLASGLVYAASKTVSVNVIDTNGLGKEIGTLRLSDTEAGLQIAPDLAGLPPGDHGLHLHVNPNCGPGTGPDGQPAAGLAAGGHYDPSATAKHLGPHGDGHKGDLPVLTVDASGKATKAVVAPRLKVSDVEGHSIMIHAGGDNYSDQPAPLGGGGSRIACGVSK
jgi:superoxide dismutase, Cu-Zn family